VSPGYRGFTVEFGPEVTLEEDLARRDLTINAIAESPDGTLLDPYGGRRDLDARLLRHVSPPLPRIRCACCEWRASPPALLRWGFRLLPRPWS